MLRKPLVNDIVRSFCWAIRQRTHSGRNWPFPVFGHKLPEPSLADIHQPAFAQFVAWAYCTERNYIICNRHIIFLAGFFRNFSVEEAEYATHLLNTYYVRTR